MTSYSAILLVADHLPADQQFAQLLLAGGLMFQVGHSGQCTADSRKMRHDSSIQLALAPLLKRAELYCMLQSLIYIYVLPDIEQQASQQTGKKAVLLADGALGHLENA